MSPKESIEQFNNQWSIYDHDGISCHEDYFRDILGPLLDINKLNGKNVADIGAGNGRFTEILAQYARHVLSIEPTKTAMENNIAKNQKYKNIIFLNKKAEDLSVPHQVDIGFCIGVLHHIPDMTKALNGILSIIKPGGTIILWLYGKEGNQVYLFAMHILKFLTPKISDKFLSFLSKLFVKPIKIYCWCCKHLERLPMANYFNHVISKLNEKEIELVIFDQLNPSTAYYLTKAEIEKLLLKCGLRDLEFYHRHNYSWTVKAKKCTL